MASHNFCPGCNARITPKEPDGSEPQHTPPSWAVLSCLKCGGLFIFDEQWREPTQEERDYMLADEQVIAHRSLVQEIQLWEQQDKETMASCVMPHLIELVMGTTSVDVAASLIAQTLGSHGFHTHPEGIGEKP